MKENTKIHYGVWAKHNDDGKLIIEYDASRFTAGTNIYNEETLEIAINTYCKLEEMFTIKTVLFKWKGWDHMY
ncbi:hypothetical protein [Thermoplasma volcanium]|uniref:hypothetical protein n=1 Tax=Thermoplasma volcanium TaxID=50339 RepID=UPI00064F29D7|nr:hypothetical protein [Thermoplasma volcanium]